MECFKMFCSHTKFQNPHFHQKYFCSRVKQLELVKFCVQTAFSNGLLKERYKGDRSDRNTRKKT
jgi:hypothetical protein